MEAKNTPSFTTAIRGYDREQVDEYVDSLAKALEDLEEAEEQNRRLQSHLSRLNARIHELEDRIRTETPHTAGALGERITLVLAEAEAGAAKAVEEAETKAAAIVDEAEARVREAEAKAASILEEAEGKGRRLESEAQNKQTALIADAERRATARTRQVEEWEQQVVAHTHAQQEYQARLFREAEDAHKQRMSNLADDHEAAVDALRDVRDTVDSLLERMSSSPAATRPEGNALPSQDQAEGDIPASGEDTDDPAEQDTGETFAVRSAGAFDHEAEAEEPELDEDKTQLHAPVEPMTSSFGTVS